MLSKFVEACASPTTGNAEESFPDPPPASFVWTEDPAACENGVETLSRSFEEDLLAAQNPIGDLKLSECGFAVPRTGGPGERETALGLWFSLGVHACLLVPALVMTLFFAPPCTPTPPFITVALVGPAGCGGGPEKTRCGAADAPGGAPGQSSAREFPGGPEHARTEPPESRPVEKAEKTAEKKKAEHAPTPKRARRAGAARSVPSTPPAPALCPGSSPGSSSGAEAAAPTGRAGSNGPGGGETAGNVAGSGGGPAGSGEGEGGGGGAGLGLGQVDTPPCALQKVEPEYPRVARQMSLAGRVVVKFLVRADGSVGKASVIEASPRGIFEQNALEAVYKWRFKPARRRGDAVAAWVVLPIQFRLSR